MSKNNFDKFEQSLDEALGSKVTSDNGVTSLEGNSIEVVEEKISEKIQKKKCAGKCLKKIWKIFSRLVIIALALVNIFVLLALFAQGKFAVYFDKILDYLEPVLSLF